MDAEYAKKMPAFDKLMNSYYEELRALYEYDGTEPDMRALTEAYNRDENREQRMHAGAELAAAIKLDYDIRSGDVAVVQSQDAARNRERAARFQL